MKALQFIASFNEEKQIDKWFLTILNNCYKDYYRSESLKGAAYEEFNEEDFPVEDRSLLVDDEALRKLNLFIQSKAEPMRTILNLYYLRGYAPRDIVYLVNKWNYNSIRALVSSAGKEFKDILRI
jgi:DNA-directed RNA polymerase specialized sigma24 family protein